MITSVGFRRVKPPVQLRPLIVCSQQRNLATPRTGEASTTRRLPRLLRRDDPDHAGSRILSAIVFLPHPPQLPTFALNGIDRLSLAGRYRPSPTPSQISCFSDLELG